MVDLYIAEKNENLDTSQLNDTKLTRITVVIQKQQKYLAKKGGNRINNEDYLVTRAGLSKVFWWQSTWMALCT